MKRQKLRRGESRDDEVAGLWFNTCLGICMESRGGEFGTICKILPSCVANSASTHLEPEVLAE
jgi:hypothetical protein